jgi:Ni,Fe-hydrogenase III large subunit
MMKHSYVADIPIIMAGIDPYMSCTDRMTALTDVRTGETKVWDWEMLRQYGMPYRNKK